MPSATVIAETPALHADQSGDLLLPLADDGHFVHLLPHMDGVWMEAYAPGIPETPRVSMHAESVTGAAAMVVQWREDYATFGRFSGMCQCGTLVGPADAHECGFTE